ncbi:MAG: hypothetical protein AAB849_01300 [Patescibacteria group bacterium]
MEKSDIFTPEEAIHAAETTVSDLVLVDEDGRTFKISGKTRGQRLPLVGAVDEHNVDLLEALRKEWLDSEGNLTENGQKEEARRAKAAGALRGQEKKRRRDGERFKREVDLGTPVQQISATLAKFGYEGSWRLMKSGGNGNYALMFFDTNGQAEEGKVFEGSIKELASKIEQHLGRIKKK